MTGSPSAPQRHAPLSVEEIAQRLEINSPDVIEDLYRLAGELGGLEATRESSINAKASTLLTASGLTLTLAFTFGGFLLQHPEIVAVVGPIVRGVLPAIYIVSIFLGLAASIAAVWALWVRGGHLSISDANVFNSTVLAEADRLEWESLRSSQLTHTSGATPDSTDGGEGAPSRALEGEASNEADPIESAEGKEEVRFPNQGTAYFRRFLTTHLWDNYNRNFKYLDAKARQVQLGQVLFILFLFGIAVIGLMLTQIAFAQQDGRGSPPPVGQCIQGPPGPPGPPGSPGGRGIPGPRGHCDRVICPTK